MKILREVLFSPGNIAGRERCYDRLEPLRKLDINPVFRSEMDWESSGIHWGSVLKSQVDGRFRFFYSTWRTALHSLGDRWDVACRGR